MHQQIIVHEVLLPEIDEASMKIPCKLKSPSATLANSVARDPPGIPLLSLDRKITS